MLKVLYADDDPVMREIAEVVLGREPDISLRTAKSGSEALATAREAPFDLVLLDVIMPDLDGPATLAAMRADPTIAKLPVGFITARAQERNHLLSLGAVGVIAKPFALASLAGEIRKLAVRSGP